MEKAENLEKTTCSKIMKICLIMVSDFLHRKHSTSIFEIPDFIFSKRMFFGFYPQERYFSNFAVLTVCLPIFLSSSHDLIITLCTILLISSAFFFIITPCFAPPTFPLPPNHKKNAEIICMLCSLLY